MEDDNPTTESFFEGLTDDAALGKLGQLIDKAGDTADVAALKQATDLCGRFRKRDLILLANLLRAVLREKRIIKRQKLEKENVLTSPARF